jgi:hypothetical protein
MTEDARLQAVMDKFEIIETSTISLCCRDSADWSRLAQCFHPEAKLTTSWFNGTAQEFVEQSRHMMEGHDAGDTQRHLMGNPWVRIKGHHAICEYLLLLFQGRTLDGYEFDFQTWAMVLDSHEKRDGAWRISKRSIIYEKGRMDPHVPGSVPQSYFDSLDLSRYPVAIRFHCYRNEKSSGRAPQNLTLKGTPEEKAARKAADDWLAAGR